MQELASQIQHARSAVLGISAYGMANRLQVHADLMRAPRVKTQAQQGHSTEGALEREVGARLASPDTAYGHLGADLRVAPDRRLDRSRSRRRAAFDHRQVFALDQALAQGGLQQAMGVLGTRDDEQTRGIPVEPVHDPGTPWLATRGPPCQQLGERALLVAAGGVHHQARGLVDYEQVLVLPDDAQSWGVIGRHCRLGLGVLWLAPVSTLSGTE